MKTATNERHLTGALLSTVFGAAVLIVGLWAAKYDIGHGQIVWSTFPVAVVGAAILFAGVDAFRGKNYWPYTTLFGSTMIIAIAFVAGKGNPLVLLTRTSAPIGVFVLIAPLMIAGYSLRAIIQTKKK